MSADDESAEGPVGQGDYVVQQGDCMESIAVNSGFLWQTLWNLPQNAQLKKSRDPNVLMAGDRVTIPPIRPRKDARATDARHRFQRNGVPSRLRLRFLDDKKKPRSGLAYVLTVDDTTTRGSLDNDGSLDVPISPAAMQGRIVLRCEPDDEAYDLTLGNLDPDGSNSGIASRLTNLGYPCAADDDDAMQSAITRYQMANDIPPTGQLDDQTRKALKQHHQS